MVKDNQNTLHFTFSPVQGFVSQSRRTRDLWAGSYLLSWLAGKAMQAAREAGGKILFPDVEQDALFRQICSPRPVTMPDQATYLGSLPNRFTASIPDNLDGTVCSQALDKAWQLVANAVYAVVEHSFSDCQKNLWKRQTENFWECTWVIGEANCLLDQRKNLRLHFPPPEDGEKCTVCGERQELSCVDFPKRKEIKKWWDNLRKNTPEEKIHGLDLKENERLCAICLTKRLFPHISTKTIGWQVPDFYPSTNYMSAVDWIIHVLDLAKEHDEVVTAASGFLETVEEAGAIVAKAEKRTWHHVQKIKELTEHLPDLNRFRYVDGSVFFKDAIFQDDFRTSAEKKIPVAKALKNLQNTVGKYTSNFAMASPFYAFLLMDGDSMGALISDRSQEERQKISQALAKFTSMLPDIVHGQNGLLIYAGGDDVFALLPVATAIECARLCRVAYQCAFKEHAPFVAPSRATISAAIQYAHMNTALGVVVRDAHILLEGVAKDRTGRDALACRVWKRGGPVLTWSQPWTVAADGLLVSAVQKAFTDDTEESVRFSSKFFYKLRDIFQFINTETFPAGQHVIKDLLVAEYLANREHSWPDDLSKQDILEKSEMRVQLLLDLCLKHRRRVNDHNEVEVCSTGHYSEAGALLIRFLTQKEV